MRKLWLVLKHEYAIAVRRRTFLLTTIGLPAFFAVIIGLSALVAIRTIDRRPLGYVDLSGVLAVMADQPSSPGGISLQGFADEEAARAALRAGTIQAFYVLPEDYLSTGRVLLFYGDKTASDDARAAFSSALRTALLAGQPAEVRARAAGGIDLTIRSADGSREINRATIVNFLVPFAAALLFTMATMTSAGYMIQAVAAEKESRTVEVMATSMTSLQLLGGKAVGLMAVALTQLAVWGLMGVAAIAVAAQFVPAFRAVSMPWTFLLVVLLFFLPAFALIASMMTAVGGMVTEVHQGQQVAGTLNLLFVVPFFFLPLIAADPNSTLAVALTLFPTTAFFTLIMRWALTVVPGWQVALSWLLLVGSAAVSLWAGARIFRAGMLRYGQPMSWRGAFGVLRRGHAGHA